jgi:prolyl 4-hydroxylase
MAGETLQELQERAHTGDDSALIALTDRLDAAGRHADALNELSRAANRGSVLAKGRVGARLMVGDRAPMMAEQGAGLVAEAAAGGSGEAAALLAVMAGAGLHRRQSWDDALDLLQRAAELGYGRAREELAVLTSSQEDAQAQRTSAEPPPDLWRRLRAGVDPAALTSAPEGRTLHDDPKVRAFDDFLPARMCAWMIERARTRRTRAMVYDQVSRADVVDETRTNSVAGFSLQDKDLVYLFAQGRIATAAGVPLAHLEVAAVLHYAVGEEITEHFDFLDPGSPEHQRQLERDGQRVATFLIYLNDDYEGGETHFPRLGLRHKGKVGDGIVFSNALSTGAADIRSVHAGRPPTRGEKWIFSQFIRNRPVLPGASPYA